MIYFCRYIAEQALEDGVNSEIFMCSMQAVEEGRPCLNIFECDPLLSCDKPVEADYYRAIRPFMAAADFVRDIIMYSICAGTSDDVEGVRWMRIKRQSTVVCFLFVACVRVREQRLLLADISPMGKRS